MMGASRLKGQRIKLGGGGGSSSETGVGKK